MTRRLKRILEIKDRLPRQVDKQNMEMSLKDEDNGLENQKP